MLHGWVFSMLVDVTAQVMEAAAHVPARQRAGAANVASKRTGEKPPSGNTGVWITRDRPVRTRPPGGVGVSVGWLSCTWVGYFATLDDFKTWCASFFGDTIYLEGRRWRGYEHVFMGEHGFMVGVRYRDGGVLELHADIPATVLEGLRLGRLVALLRSVHLHAHNVTRLDVTLDDWQKVITPEQLRDLTTNPRDRNELVRDDIVTRAKKTKFDSSTGDRGGDTWYLGGTSGDTRLRVYDKHKESAGEVDSIRWELQIRNEPAREALARLIGHIEVRKSSGLSGARALEAIAGGWAAAQLVGFVDFRDRNSDSNISRADRRFWWLALVLDAVKARPERVEPPLTVNRLHDYAVTALPSLLATLADSAPLVVGRSPFDYLRDLVIMGRERRSPRHQLALRSAGVTA